MSLAASKRWFKRSLYLLAGFLLIGVGWQGHALMQTASSEKKLVRGAKKFRFTSPLLDVALPEGVSIRNEPIPFRYKIKSYVDHIEHANGITRVSVYFRDLNDGPWFGINAEREFDGASLLKVPVMIAWLKRAEKHPEILKRVYIYDGKYDLTSLQGIKPNRTLSSGVGYKVEDLLHYMLSHSDNNATKILYDNLSSDEISEVLENMDVTNNPSDNSNLISLIGYSGFFRILYNASFLNREMSEKALEFLAIEDFPQGIAAGVPKGVPIAAKFGEFVHGNNGADKELHEFGIVYHPGGPYILGIMTEGDNFERQGEVIRVISAMVYSEVSTSITKNSR